MIVCWRRATEAPLAVINIARNTPLVGSTRIYICSDVVPFNCCGVTAVYHSWDKQLKYLLPILYFFGYLYNLFCIVKIRVYMCRKIAT